MLDRFKKWFGIEGLKINLDLQEKYAIKESKLYGTIELLSKNEELVQNINLKLIERYARGRGKNKLINEYVLADRDLNENIWIVPDQIESIPFELEYDLVLSNMDRLQNKNFIASGIVSAAKFLKRANSTYFLIVEANVKGTGLKPFAKEEINLV